MQIWLLLAAAVVGNQPVSCKQSHSATDLDTLRLGLPLKPKATKPKK